MQCIDDFWVIIWDSTAEEVFDKREQIIQILLKASFATKQSKVRGPAQEIQFFGCKMDIIRLDMVNRIAAISLPTSKKETQLS